MTAWPTQRSKKQEIRFIQHWRARRGDSSVDETLFSWRQLLRAHDALTTQTWVRPPWNRRHLSFVPEKIVSYGKTVCVWNADNYVCFGSNVASLPLLEAADSAYEAVLHPNPTMIPYDISNAKMYFNGSGLCSITLNATEMCLWATTISQPYTCANYTSDGDCLSDTVSTCANGGDRLNNCVGESCVPACGPNGTCVIGANSETHCECDVGWRTQSSSAPCSKPTCESMGGCGNGACFAFDECNCWPNWRTDINGSCTIPQCYGTYGDQECGDHGSCVAPDRCECDTPHTGSRCDDPQTVFKIPATSPSRYDWEDMLDPMQLFPKYNAWGDESYAQDLGFSASQIARGSKHSCAIDAKDATTIKCWGSNDYGQLGFHGQSQSYVKLNDKVRIPSRCKVEKSPCWWVPYLRRSPNHGFKTRRALLGVGRAPSNLGRSRP